LAFPRQLYSAFTILVRFPSRNFMPERAFQWYGCEELVVGDVISLLAGGVIFAVLIAYVPACEKV
jgi:hypothetical protein